LQELDQSQQAHIAVIRHEYSLIGKAIVNADFTFRDPNEQLCQYLGVTKAELIGRRFGDITPSPLKEIDEANARLVREGKITCYNMPKIYQISLDSMPVYANISVIGLHRNQKFDGFQIEIMRISEELFHTEKQRLLGSHPLLHTPPKSWLNRLLLSMRTWSRKDWIQLIAAISGAMIAVKEVIIYLKERLEILQNLH
jgi:PAS domain S-box-containing protein